MSSSYYFIADSNPLTTDSDLVLITVAFSKVECNLRNVITLINNDPWLAALSNVDIYVERFPFFPLNFFFFIYNIIIN